VPRLTVCTAGIIAGPPLVDRCHQRRGGGRMVAWDAAEHVDLRSTAATAVVAGVGGLMLLTSLPLAQYFVLRDHVRRPAPWIPINTFTWLLGIAVDARAFPGSGSINTCWCSDLDLWHRGVLHGGDGSGRHRGGNDSAVTAADQGG
jgi:hypothetical protein